MKPIKRARRLTSLIICVLVVFVSWARFGWANGEITTHEEATSSVVAVVISVLGGAIAILGILVAAKGGSARSNFKITFGEKKTLTLTKLTQGVVIVLVGAAILIVGLYNLPKVMKEETIKAKIIEEKDGKKFLAN